MVASTSRFDKASSPQPEMRCTCDESLLCEVNGVLRTSGYSALTYLRCEVNDGVLTLTGNVPSFYLKQLAQHYAARTTGVKKIHNQVFVVDERS